MPDEAHHCKNHHQRSPPLSRLPSTGPYRTPASTMTKIALWATVASLSVFATASPFHFDQPGRLEKRLGGKLFDNIPASQNLTWHPCPQYEGVQCAKLLLPRDWKDPAGKKLAIALVKQPATVPEESPDWAGPLFFNPGGPGGEAAVQMLWGQGESMQGIVGSNYTVIGIDPRAVGFSEPEANCMQTPVQFLQRFFRMRQGMRSIVNGGSEAAEETYSIFSGYNSHCVEKYGTDGVFKYVGTAAVARDHMAVNDLIWEAVGKKPRGLQYWGFSYGTILGQYIATLFPDRVDRLILDGVADSDAWQTTHENELSWIADTDKALESFSTYCAASSKCTMNPAGKESAASIRKRVNRILEHVKKAPIVPTSTQVPVNFQRFATFIFSSLYDPLFMFPYVSKLFTDIETTILVGKPFVAFEQFISIITGWYEDDVPLSCSIDDTTFPDYGFGGSEAFQWIKCGDRTKFETMTPASFKGISDRMQRVSEVGTIQIQNAGRCAGFDDPKQFQAVETIPKLGAKTKNPILFIGNTADPVTPLRNAFSMSKKFPGSGVLEQQSTGHCTSSSPSACTALIIADYFATGKLPKFGTKCKVDELPFENDARYDIFQEVADEAEMKPFVGKEKRRTKNEGDSVIEAAVELGEKKRKAFVRKMLLGKGAFGIAPGI
ncbi:alpha/beta-hydrolase [Ascobolus immersus RN42]|uniref:Alpha/beta-hydrolase n=1 Tax=Ascobolus immersus RN42 TaxID=1160509 RepID=A0A3N4IL92_ASCIM|nr:alpha/beta-hydrolase [Ascobolus immersus RN42]